MPKKHTCQKNVNVIYQVYQHTEKVMKCKKTNEKSESVTVPKQFKTPESQNGMFFSTLIQFIHELAPRSL